MRSAASVWARAPWSPITELAATHRVIAMDQRNAGASTAEVTGSETWGTYAEDQLGLLDHLGIERCHVVGMCIGGPFILRLLQEAPERFERAVILAPNGLDNNRDSFRKIFDDWAAELAPQHPEAGPAEWAAYRESLYGVDDVLLSVPETLLPTIRTPLMVLQEDNLYHPLSTSLLLASAVPGARLVERWKEPADLIVARTEIAEFLTP
ncbi:alpha/beta fold hydrolase [Streptomyces sp. NPDC048278]|uniref:alpha/beta fold hydrolase n=1 Tax=Streptomyces sp. NPDC048278 TaxID=3155809 RepID=UPI003442FD55